MLKMLTCATTMLAFGLPAISLAQQSTTPIRHVVVIVQENVSFDHYFATYPWAANPAGEPAFVPRHDLVYGPNGPLRLNATPSVNGLSTDGVTGILFTNNPNSANPFRLDRSENVTCDQDHNYSDEQTAFNGGLMNKFVESVGVDSPGCTPNVPKSVLARGKALVMGYYDGNTVTALWNYAQHYAMSDSFFSTTFGPSSVGHQNIIAGTTHGATVAKGSSANVVAGSMIGAAANPAYDDCSPASGAQVAMSGKNIGDLLNGAGLSWGWFMGGFKPSKINPDGTAVCGAAHIGLPGGLQVDYFPNHEPFQYWTQTANPHHLPPSSVAAIGSTDQANHQYDIGDWWNALNSANLPAVSFLKAPGYQDGHAGYSDPLDEQTFLTGVLNGLMQSPYWNQTAVFLVYDDSDGWYDHVMPPIVRPSATSADTLNGPGVCGGTPAPDADQGRCGFGQRLPLLVLSPWTRENYIDHTLTDQSSIIRFIEDNWSLGRLGGQASDALAGSLMGMFDFQTPSHTQRTLILDPSTGLQK